MWTPPNISTYTQSLVEDWLEHPRIYSQERVGTGQSLAALIWAKNISIETGKPVLFICRPILITHLENIAKRIEATEAVSLCSPYRLPDDISQEKFAAVVFYCAPRIKESAVVELLQYDRMLAVFPIQ